MNVLVIGKGGREHALVWKLAQSARVTKVFCAPGNSGTGLDGINVAIDQNDFDALAKFAKRENVALTVVGPEEPLALGIVDFFQNAGLRIFGPTKAAAQVEASKVFAKKLMRDSNVPTAEFRIFDHPDPARAFISTREYPMVVKADGLAAGKGVVVCDTTEEALAAIDLIMVKEEFGRAAGRQVVIEKRLEGEELSVLALVAGRTILPLAPAQDHKRAFDGDLGPNTGGMGAYSPPTLATTAILNEVEAHALVPTVHSLKRRRTPFRGVLYAGVLVTNQGPRILEYNGRFGDPETQPVLMRLKTDLFELLLAVAEDRLADFGDDKLIWDPRPAVCVVMASQGYPGAYPRGKLITGLDEVAKMKDVKVFHGGAKFEAGHFFTDGGRVLGVTALGDTLADARYRVYEAVAKINFAGAFYRKDIGSKGLEPKPVAAV